jgi:starch synthase
VLTTISAAPAADVLTRPSETIVRRRAPRRRVAPAPTPAIIHLSAELWPYAYSGGLGYAVADLAAQQARNGRDVTVIAPLYRAVRERGTKLRALGDPFTVHQAGADEPIQCFEAQRTGTGARVVFIDHPASFDRAGLYGENGSEYGDNARRFALFVLAALEYIRRQGGDRPLIVHAHDWHAALAPVVMRVAGAADPDFRRMGSVISIHNAGYQGLFDRAVMGSIGLPDELWSPDSMEFYGRLSFLKGGLRYADIVTTVSETHASEMRTEVGGFGLQDVFRRLGDRFVGIRNGIDPGYWDPGMDAQIAAHFGPTALSGKSRCKAELQLASRLPRADVPVFALSARLVHQKGIDLLLGSDVVRTSQAQFIFHGEGELHYEQSLIALAQEHPNRIHTRITFSERFEHQLLAGADFLLMPSQYEPCGLTQMRAQRYGTLPVARRVGGLAETVVDEETGFLFDTFSVPDLDQALQRAISLYAEPRALRRRAVDAMCRDFSWSRPLAAYDEVYRKALSSR